MNHEKAGGAPFRRARTKEQIAQRQDEIVTAAAKLLKEGGIDAVTFTAISEMTSIQRQAIYKYYASREEVLLDLLVREEQSWEQDIYAEFAVPGGKTREEFAEMMTRLFVSHAPMLQLTALLFNVLEANCRLEKLVEFRSDSVDVYHILYLCAKRYFPQATGKDYHNFAGVVYAFVAGLYPMNHVSEKFLEAERLADAFHVYPEAFVREDAFRTQCYRGILFLVNSLS